MTTTDDESPIIDASFAPKLLPPPVALRRSPKANRAHAIREAHPEWVEEIAFVCWVEGNRKIAEALRLYRLRQEARFEDEEPLPDLTRTTLQSWVTRHDWNAKADQIIATNFPGLRMRQIARLVYAGGAALDALIDAVTGDMAGVKPQERVKAAEILLVAGGLGTHGSRERLAPVVKVVEAQTENLEDLTEQELGRLAMAAIRKSRNTDPERRKR